VIIEEIDKKLDIEIEFDDRLLSSSWKLPNEEEIVSVLGILYLDEENKLNLKLKVLGLN